MALAACRSSSAVGPVVRGGAAALVVHAPRAPASSAALRRAAEWAPSCPLHLARARKVIARAAEPAAPSVQIDNIHDPFATIVRVDIGDATELLGTVTALQSLGLNIRKAKVQDNTNEFYLTEGATSEKIVKSARLEEVRHTVMASLQENFPESGGAFNMGDVSPTGAGMDATRSWDDPSVPVRKVVQTTIDIVEAPNGSCSLLTINTADRPGLLVDIVRVLKDVNLNVVSAEVDTIGSQAHDEFFVTYKGAPLTTPMQTLVINSLNYYLSLNEVATVESY